jgi:23S rRNA (cytosine1962-C5)-methyltransferase
MDVLNLFAYTGPTSLIAAAAGAKVCHVDAVKDINDWARENARQSDLENAPIRWLTDDVMKFCKRECRRGNRYQGFILDPPTFGRGPKSEKWVLEEHLVPLMEDLLKLGNNDAQFVLLTCHTPGVTAPALVNLLRPWLDTHGGSLQAGHMLLKPVSGQNTLPSGVYARWQKNALAS